MALAVLIGLTAWLSWRGWHQDKRRDDRLSRWLSPGWLRVTCSLSWLAVLTGGYLLNQQQMPVS